MFSFIIPLILYHLLFFVFKYINCIKQTLKLFSFSFMRILCLILHNMILLYKKVISLTIFIKKIYTYIDIIDIIVV